MTRERERFLRACTRDEWSRGGLTHNPGDFSRSLRQKLSCKPLVNIDIRQIHDDDDDNDDDDDDDDDDNDDDDAVMMITMMMMML